MNKLISLCKLVVLFEDDCWNQNCSLMVGEEVLKSGELFRGGKVAMSVNLHINLKAEEKKYTTVDAILNRTIE